MRRTGKSEGHQGAEGRRGVVERVRPDAEARSGDLNFGADYTVTSTTDNGGTLLLNVEVILCFWGKSWTQTPAPVPSSDDIEKAIRGIVTGPYMGGLSQYRGVAQGTLIYTDHNDTSDPADLYTDADVVTMLQSRLQNTSMPPPTTGHNRFYAVIVPVGIRNSITKFAGQHQSFSYNGVTAYYAWVDNTGSLTGHDSSTKVLSHELVETCTNPNVTSSNDGILVDGTNADGSSVTNDEIGDTCNNQFATVVVNGVSCTVQSYWSKADNACILPLGALSFWIDKNSFGKDEVKDVIDTNGGVFSNAFWLVLEDFSVTTFNSFGVSIPTPTGAFANIPGVTITPSPAVPGGPIPAQAIPVPEDPGNPDAIQRIRFSFDITFTNAIFDALTTPFPASGVAAFTLDGSIVISGVALPGAPSQTSALFDFLSGADPYFTNIDPSNPGNNVSWLSQDLRVFSVTQGESALAGDPNAPVFSSSQSPYDYIQSLLGYLNGATSYTAPVPASSADPLNALPGQTGYETADSSVTPVDAAGHRNFNFAIARVRLRAETQGPAGAADAVRVFFRLWVAPSCDTDFQPGTTYLSNPPFPALPTNPLPSAANLPPDPSGQAIRTVPFFATDASGTNDYNTAYAGTNNISPIEVPVVLNQDAVWHYYGCVLDVYDASNNSKFPGTHHCLVAQIAYDGAPILNQNGITLSPGNSDKLAQRNLQITLSGNPGPASTHRIPQAFDLRSSAPFQGPNGEFSGAPDELMIDWGNVPVGSTVNVYWPQVKAADVVGLAGKLYRTHLLSVADVNTIRLKVTGGVSYVPIPAAPNVNFAGLLTIDLPIGVVSGQEFNVMVRRIAVRTGDPVILLARNAQPKFQAGTAARDWRYNAGTFQIRIPVTTEDRILPSEENTLAILKWRLANMSLSYRWYPVLKRYVEYVAARVDGCGGNSATVLPSPLGVPVKTDPQCVELTGKVCEVVYDCFGDFCGFVLSSCCEEHRYESRERAIGALVLRACQERLRLTVASEGCGILKIIVRD